MRRMMGDPPLKGPSRTLGIGHSPSIAMYMHDLSGGGVERQSLVIAEEFRNAGLKVTLLLHRNRGPLADVLPTGLEIIALGGSRTLTDIPRLVGYLRYAKPDILLANVDINNVAALVAKALSFGQTKVIICQHNALASSGELGDAWHYAHVARAYRILSPLISKAVAVSCGVGEELRAHAGLDVHQVATINNPVIGPDFSARLKADVFHPWLKDRETPLFVTAGRLVPQKDHETMIRAFAVYRQKTRGRLIILGSGPLHDHLLGLATRLEVDKDIDFRGFQTNILPFIRQADAFVLSSRCEGFGNVVVEALGCGTPVISTDCAHGPSEILASGRYGVLVEPGSPASLAAAMGQVATLRVRFPAKLLQNRAEDYTYHACAKRYMTLFQMLMP